MSLEYEMRGQKRDLEVTIKKSSLDS